ncbi:OmpA family protein [Geomonas sp. Red32]|uniref:OmpA family protein n=1 Tax=Geomonas sp. Red32 TaxID=2912856 RepID=UPI00202D0808|nr:OmpA family protein [Geomonas sp. Red32]MCM0082582.1 OmpA family protein [Geomonas sp. Red32]
MTGLLRLILAVAVIAVVCGCAGPRTLVALAPDPDGHVGAITVENEGEKVAIDQPYRATVVKGEKGAPAPPEDIGKGAVEAAFGEALSIEPKPPVHFLLYFDRDTELTAASRALIPAILAAIATRASQEVWAIGHTDTVGSADYNTALSRRRAETVRELLVKNGVPESYLRTTSHGKENPLVPTGDNVYEPRNRRVEVVVH